MKQSFFCHLRSFPPSPFPLQLLRLLIPVAKHATRFLDFTARNESLSPPRVWFPEFWWFRVNNEPFIFFLFLSLRQRKGPQKLPQHHCIRYDIYVLINQVQLCRVSYHFIRLWNFNAMKMKNAWNWMKAHLSLGTKGTQILFIVIHVDPLFLSANILCFPISTRLSYRRVHFYHTVVRYSKAFLLDVTWLLSMYANICLLYVSRIHVLCCKSPIEQNILQSDFWPFVCAI